MESEAHSMRLPSISEAEPDRNSLAYATEDDCVSGQVHHLYFVKLHRYENPNLVTAENLIRKLDRDLVLLNQKREEKLMYRNKLRPSPNNRNYHCRDWHSKRGKLRSLQLSLDKLCFANNSSRGKAIRPCSTVEEIDNHCLYLGLLHTSKSLGEERQILRKIKDAEKMPEDATIRDYDSKIHELTRRMLWGINITTDEKIRIFDEIQMIKRARVEAIERATERAAVNGKMWRSLGSKENIVQQTKTMQNELDEERAEHLKYNVKVAGLRKELEAVEDELRSVEKQLAHTRRLKNEAFESITRWKTEQEEKNASYNRHVKLVRIARELAERKELAALQQLSNDEVEKFMSQWNNDRAFRDEYRMRAAGSLDERGLNLIGRRRSRDEKTFMKDPTIKMSKSLNQALRKFLKEDPMH